MSEFSLNHKAVCITALRSIPSAVDNFFNFVDGFLQIIVVFQTALDFFAAVQNRRMIPAAEILADVGKAHVQHILAEEHGNMPGVGNALIPPLGLQIRRFQMIIFGDSLFNQFRRKRLLFVAADQTLQNLVAKSQIDNAAVDQRRIIFNSVKRPLQLTDIGRNVGCDELDGVVGDIDTVLVSRSGG